jgi:hypothetical protein
MTSASYMLGYSTSVSMIRQASRPFDRALTFDMPSADKQACREARQEHLFMETVVRARMQHASSPVDYG